MTIGDGNRASFWFDNWSTLGRLMNTASINTLISLGVPIDATVAQASLSLRRGRLRHQVCRRIVDVTETVLMDRSSNQQDKDRWKANQGKFAGYFNSKNTWNLIRNTMPQMPHHQAIWFPHSTPKYSFLVWLANMNRLSTGDRHADWTSRDQIKCMLCGCILESRDHLFFICRFSGSIWGATLGNLMPNFTSPSWDTITQTLAQGSSMTATSFLSRYAFQTCVYYIWRERNNRKHGSVHKSESTIIRLIDKDIRNKISSMRYEQNNVAATGLKVWFQTRLKLH